MWWGQQRSSHHHHCHPLTTAQGKEVRPDKAKKIGLVDAVCDPAALEALAVQTALDLATKPKKPRKKSWRVLLRLSNIFYTGDDFNFN